MNAEQFDALIEKPVDAIRELSGVDLATARDMAEMRILGFREAWYAPVRLSATKEAATCEIIRRFYAKPIDL